MKLLLIAFTLTLTPLSSLLAQLPSTTEYLGQFLRINDRKFQFHVTSDGTVQFHGLKDRDTPMFQEIRIYPRVQTLNSSGKWVIRKMDKDSLEPVGEPSVDPEGKVGFRARSSTDTLYEVMIENDSGVLAIHSKILDWGKADKDKTRILISIKIPDFYYRFKSAPKDERELKRAVRGGQLRAVNLKNQNVRLNYHDYVDLEDKEVKDGFRTVEVRTDNYGIVKSISIEPKDKKNQFIAFDYKDESPIYKGGMLRIWAEGDAAMEQGTTMLINVR